MVLPGAGGPTQGCGTGGPSTLLVGVWGWLCTHTPGYVPSQLCSQPLLTELPRTHASTARQSRAKDTCRECGQHAGEHPASSPARAATSCSGERAHAGEGRGSPQRRPQSEAHTAGGEGTRLTHRCHTASPCMPLPHLLLCHLWSLHAGSSQVPSPTAPMLSPC